MERAEKLYKAVGLLLDVCKEIQDKARESLLEKTEYVGFAKEYCTIKLGGARGSGHTTLINLLLQRKFPKSLVLFYNLKMMQLYKRHYDKGNKKSIFLSIGSDLGKLAGHRGFDAIIIDCASIIPKTKMDNIYKILATEERLEKEFYFILLE